MRIEDRGSQRALETHTILDLRSSILDPQKIPPSPIYPCSSSFEPPLHIRLERLRLQVFFLNGLNGFGGGGFFLHDVLHDCTRHRRSRQ